MIKFGRLCLIAVMAIYLMVACTTTSDSFLEEFELPILGEGDEGEELEVPPGLVTPKVKDDYIIPGSKMSMRSAVMTSFVLPERLDMRLFREGDTAWLLIGLSPADVWEYVRTFFEGYGFRIIGQNPAAGVMETDWLERVVKRLDGVQIRDKFRIRLERDANALTNIYIVNRRNQYRDGEWQLSFSDIETELDVLYDLRDYFAQLQTTAEPGSAIELEDLTHPLEIIDMEGVPVLTIGSTYSDVWRKLGVALERSEVDVYDSDRSRGIYMVRYATDSIAQFEDTDAEFMQLHLLDRGTETLITVHPARSYGRTLPYAAAHQLLKQIVWVY